MNPDSFGNLPASACSLGGQSAYGPDRITKTVYDAAGQVVQVRQAVGTSVERVYSTFAYSPNGKVTDSIDANGNRTKMTYDGFDRLSAVYYPDTNRPGGWNPATQATALATAGSHSGSDYEAYAYDENGNRSWWRRRDGNYIYYNYDNLNREILHYNPNGLIPHLYTTYDLTGKVLKKRFNDWNGPGVTYTYDGLGRLQTATDMNGRPLTFYYNQASARTVMTFPDGKTQFYGLDGLNRVVYSDISNSGVAMCLGYDDLGRLSGRCWANNTSEGLGYDNQSRLTNLNYYFPDGSKNIYWGFAYNPANQITTLYANNTTQYDFRETQVQTDNRAFDGLNRDSGIAALSGGYDARGNMTNDGSRQMVYDLYNRLMSVTGNGQNLQMNYDPEGRLASYTVNGATTTFLYDGVKLIAEYDGSGNMQKRYLHGIGTDDPWAELTGSDVNSGTVKYLYANYQGSVFAQANGSGTITDTYKYGPYGEPKNAADQTSFSGSRFRYTGQTVLPEAQLYYYKARVYDPIHGRFLQTDPIGSQDDLNLYAYTGGDPINGTDPSGLASTDSQYSCAKVGCTTSGYAEVSSRCNDTCMANSAKASVVTTACLLGSCSKVMQSAGLGGATSAIYSVVEQKATTGSVDGNKVMSDAAKGASTSALGEVGGQIAKTPGKVVGAYAATKAEGGSNAEAVGGALGAFASSFIKGNKDDAPLQQLGQEFGKKFLSKIIKESSSNSESPSSNSKSGYCTAKIGIC